MKWLRTFDLYVHDSRDPVAIKRGWSWPAFVWPVLWPAMIDLKPLFWTVSIVCALSVKLGSLGPSLIFGNYEVFPFTFTPVLIGVILGAIGNSLKRNRVEAVGYRRVDTVRASSMREALAGMKKPEPMGAIASLQ
jgi:hypothetical protein